MKLKCIGGPADGRYWDVESVMRVGDFVRVNEYPKPFSAVPLNYDSQMDRVTVINYIYRIAIFHFSKDDTYKFLVSAEPVRMTDKQAIMHQFDKPNPLQFFDPEKRIMRTATQADLDKINEIHIAAMKRKP